MYGIPDISIPIKIEFLSIWEVSFLPTVIVMSRIQKFQGFFVRCSQKIRFRAETF